MTAKQELIRRLTEVVAPQRILADEPMAKHTTFRIGGPADVMVLPCGEAELRAVLEAVEICGLPCFVMGNGSNLLVSDAGIRGLVIKIDQPMAKVTIDAAFAYAQAGAGLGYLARRCAQQGLRGLVFACGIPGSVGGAVVMNAGAYGGEIKDVLHSVTVLSDGCVKEWPADQLKLGYRTSIFKASKDIILGARFQLCTDCETDISEEMAELMCQRNEKQPVQLPSAGSTFKRPQEGYASAMIDGAGLKGLSVGGAQVSAKHAGFIVNTGGATARDVLSLMRMVQARVKSAYGVQLEPEVKLVGEGMQGQID
ncbi:MAG: UDP-N-acetylmuramate dehydrogenase [Christensenellales bacterium]|jgi:UDP-N-acetylmuramate dehydrogenase